MESMYLLIPLSVVIVVLAGWVFLRMSSGGQFDDLDSPGVRVLLDDDRPRDDRPRDPPAVLSAVLSAVPSAVPPVAPGTTPNAGRDFG